MKTNWMQISPELAAMLHDARPGMPAKGAAGVQSRVSVTFAIAKALFAVPVAPVVEILDIREIAPLPRTPPHVLGLIDRRGVSVPVVDMRLMLAQAPQEDTHETRIVVLRMSLGGERMGLVGLRVDRVIEVAELEDAGDGMLPEAELLQWNERMVAGIARRDGLFVTCLDVDNLFGQGVRAIAAHVVEAA
ncbi:chemotaxis protein CheW [Pseudooceanicola sediminis]|mgnify:CR=1 FL=1|nr:chemotaxis protein CheW [Pseudooceanicola sediminis]